MNGRLPMMPLPPRESRQVLDPLERLSEILFGLIMALTFTLSLGVATAGREDVTTMLIGALGCNLAWGIIDAAMYLGTVFTVRARDLSTLRQVQAASDAQVAESLIRDALPPLLAGGLRSEEIAAVRERLRGLPEPGRPGITAADVRGAFGVLLLVFLSTLPVALPFLVLSTPQVALRASNAVALLLLFGCGWGLARYAGLRPVRTGLVMAAAGTALVLTAIALGG